MDDVNPGEVMNELPDAIRPLRRVEFDELVRAGCFEDERVELLFGALVEMTPTDPRHDESINRIARTLFRELGDRANVRVQSSFAASEYSEPLPDIVVAPAGEYWDAHPSRALLVVEVSNTSQRKDRGVKARLYGSTEVDEYWIVDVREGVVDVHRQPSGDGRWADVRRHPRGDRIAPAAWPDVVIDVDEIVPPIR